MMTHYGWTGNLRHGLWRCGCEHWNYYRTLTLRIDSYCNAQGCSYRARVVLDRQGRKGGRPRQVIIHEYPNYRPATSIRIEQKERNRYRRQNREQGERMALKMDRGVFHSAKELQTAQDNADLERHGGIFRLVARPDLKRHPETGDSRIKYLKKKD